jgi:hypothetical protein
MKRQKCLEGLHEKHGVFILSECVVDSAFVHGWRELWAGHGVYLSGEVGIFRLPGQRQL